jgi:hypothetical protein
MLGEIRSKAKRPADLAGRFTAHPGARNDKGPVNMTGPLRYRVPDDDLLSHGNSVLSSACRRFTVLFEMGRGGSSGLWSSGIDGLSSRHRERRGISVLATADG